MQDIPGLAECFGGRDDLIAKLDENFAKHNVHGNEPQHHYPYLYDYVGQPWKTQAAVREYLATKYRNAGSGGYDGDEDCGQMSAWYVFSALGFYPVAPGSGEYAIGSPLFDEATLAIGAPYAPAVFKVVAQNQSSANRYIQSAALNGVPVDRPFLRHADIIKGGSLVFTMGPLPNKKWGVGK
jgi:predicted alpha-1,2-mannosidase